MSERREPLNRRISRRLYRASGWLWRIKTPQRIYRFTDDHELKFAGVRLCPSVTGVRLYELAEDMDPEHFDHWAHEWTDADGGKVSGHLCIGCGGWNVFDQPQIEVST